MLATFAAWFLVFAFIATALFHFAIVLGAPLGEYSYGGRTVGKLPSRYRFSSLISFGVMLAFAGHYLAFLGVFQPIVGQQIFTVINWGLVAFAALAALLNNITRSQKEKRLWGGVTLAMFLATIVVAFA